MVELSSSRAGEGSIVDDVLQAGISSDKKIGREVVGEVARIVKVALRWTTVGSKMTEGGRKRKVTIFNFYFSFSFLFLFFFFYFFF